MKKIFLIALVVLITTASFAQTENKAVRTMTTEEANRLNGTVEPTINGKPYSQYAAEQRALKQQNVNRQITNVPASDPTSSNTTYRSTTPVKPEVNQLKGNETTEPASMINTQPALVDKTTQVQLTDEQKAAQLEMIRSTSVRGVTEPAPAKTQPAGTNPVRTPAELEKLKADQEAAEKKSVKPAVENKGATTSPLQLSVGKTKTD